MKKTVALFLTLILLFSLCACSFVGVEITVTDGVVHVNSTLPQKVTLVGDEDKEIENREFYKKLMNAIDGKSAEAADLPEGHIFNCECEETYILRISGNYPYGYYLTLHNNGIDISQFCKFRKCMDLLGFVEVDEATMTELICMLNKE